MKEREESRSGAYRVAFCALMAALGAALMTTGGLIPVATYCSPLLAGILLLPVLCEFGRREAWMVWAVTAALALILSVDKEAGAFYLFLGWYPILKPNFDRIRPKPLSFAAKTLLFAAEVTLMYVLLLYVFALESVLEDHQSAGFALSAAMDGVLVITMLLYDFVLGRLWLWYVRRLRPRLVRRLR